MAVIQDQYNDTPTKGFPGMVSNMEPGNRISRTVEDVAGLAFGAPAWQGSGDRGCTGVPGTADNFLGFVIADHGQPLMPGGTADTIPRYESAALMSRTTIYVRVGQAVTKRQAVTIGTGANAAHGISAAPADATHVAAPGWIFDETVAAGGICRLARR